METYNATTADAANLNIDAMGNMARSVSSISYKKDIEPLDGKYADAVVFGARPVWYRSTCQNDNPVWSYYGIIAEELAQIDPRLVIFGRTEDGRMQPEGVRYARIVVLLIDVVQRMKRRLDELDASLAALQAQTENSIKTKKA